MIFLLGTWPSHADYQLYAADALSEIAKQHPYALWEYQDPISKVFILNLDPLKSKMFALYSSTGRPAENQPEIFRSLIMMVCLKYSLDEWVQKLHQLRNCFLNSPAGIFACVLIVESER